MRDPNRIPIILEKLNRVWAAAPDLRLGQMVSILTWKASKSKDTFNTEDNELEAALDEMIKNPPKYLYPNNKP